MCVQCQQLEISIQRYRGFVKAGFDALTIERIKELIEELQRRKEAMHYDNQGLHVSERSNYLRDEADKCRHTLTL
jgi:hypothetical protein